MLMFIVRDGQRIVSCFRRIVIKYLSCLLTVNPKSSRSRLGSDCSDLTDNISVFLNCCRL